MAIQHLSLGQFVAMEAAELAATDPLVLQKYG